MTRPVLFGAEPLGRGTGAVESLTGFFARLCVERSLLPTQVVRAYVVERCPSGFFPPTSIALGTFFGHASGFDFRPDRALPFASAIEDLTCIGDLRALTFSVGAELVFSGVRYPFGRRRKRWCPACFADWFREGTPIYEPLLWRFSLVEHCPVHRLPLLGRCPFCARTQPLVTRGVPMGHCVYCGHYLHEGAVVVTPEERSLSPEDRWALWRAVALSRIVACSSAPRAASVLVRARFLACFLRLLESVLATHSGLRERSRLAAACALGLNPADFYSILSGEARPALRFFLDACMQLGVDPARVARGACLVAEGTWPPSSGWPLAPCSDPWAFALEVRESSSARRYPSRARALDTFISDPRAVDLARLMREHRASAPWLRLSFPLRHDRARKLRAQRVASERGRRFHAFHSVLKREIAGGAPRTLVAVAESLGTSTTALCAVCPELSSELVALRGSSSLTHASGLSERIRAALVAALETPHGPTLNSVARSLGLARFQVYPKFPQLCARLVSLRREEREARPAHCARALRVELARATPRGVTFVAKQLGVSLRSLQSADPALYEKLVDARLDLFRGRPSASQVRVEAKRALRAPLAEALERELCSGAPRSTIAVAADCGVFPSLLLHYCPEQYRRLVQLRRTIRARDLERLRAALEQEIPIPEPRSQQAFCDDHRVTRRFLVDTFPSLAADLRAAALRVRRPSPPRCPDYPRLLEALEVETRSSSPRSLRTFSRALGVSPNKLRGVSSDAVHRLVCARAVHSRRRDAELTVQIVRSLSAALLSDDPPSTRAVGRQLDLDPNVMKRLAPDLYHELIARLRSKR